MGRLFLILRLLLVLLIFPFCLFLQDQPCACYKEFPQNFDDSQRIQLSQEKLLAGPVQERGDYLAGLAGGLSFQTFPGALPWEAVRRIGVRTEQYFDKLLRDRPTVFLQMCLDRYDREVQGYSCILAKTEWVRGKPERVEAHFREKPFSVYMNWLQNQGKAARVLYVEGENNGKMLARPWVTFLPVREVKVDDDDVKKTGRYLITEFGIKLGTERTLKAMKAAQKRGTLHVTYQGIFRVPETGDRLCYKLVRTPYDPPEDEGVNELTIYIDIENWLQVGSILKDAEGKLIADYFFRDIKINPKFKPNQFSRSAL